MTVNSILAAAEIEAFVEAVNDVKGSNIEAEFDVIDANGRSKPAATDSRTAHPYHLHFITKSGENREWSGSNTHSRAYFYYATLEEAQAEMEKAYANHDAGKATNFKAPRGRLAVMYFDGHAPSKRVA